MSLKRYSVQAFFPEARSHAAEQMCSVDAMKLEEAAKRGLRELRKRGGIKGKVLTTVKLTIRCIGPATKEAIAARAKNRVTFICSDCENIKSGIKGRPPKKCVSCGARGTYSEE